MMMNSRPHLSIIVPLYNEEESVHLLYEKIHNACDSLGRPYEMVFIDDGSRDRTFTILEQIHQQDSRVKVVKFRKNYGQTPAMAAGFRAARGKIVISMDGDLQNDPNDIPRLLEKVNENYDVVCGWRKERKDKLISRRIPSIIANWLIGRITGVHIHDNGCSLKAYRTSVIKKVTLYGEMHRFIPAMSSLTGARIGEMVVNHHPRRYGTSKYGIGRVWRVILDIITIKMITGFASRPALWFGMLSIPFFMFGLLFIILSMISYFNHTTGVSIIFPSVCLLFFFLGSYLLSLGFVSEMILRTGDYSQKRLVMPTTREIIKET